MKLIEAIISKKKSDLIKAATKVKWGIRVLINSNTKKIVIADDHNNVHYQVAIEYLGGPHSDSVDFFSKETRNKYLDMIRDKDWLFLIAVVSKNSKLAFIVSDDSYNNKKTNQEILNGLKKYGFKKIAMRKMSKEEHKLFFSDSKVLFETDIDARKIW